MFSTPLDFALYAIILYLYSYNRPFHAKNEVSFRVKQTVPDAISCPSDTMCVFTSRSHAFLHGALTFLILEAGRVLGIQRGKGNWKKPRLGGTMVICVDRVVLALLLHAVLYS
jgi:hypothetical protein